MTFLNMADNKPDNCPSAKETSMTKINLDDVSRPELAKMIFDMQYVLDGMWVYEEELCQSTGIPVDQCTDLLESINKFLSINVGTSL